MRGRFAYAASLDGCIPRSSLVIQRRSSRGTPPSRSETERRSPCAFFSPHLRGGGCSRVSCSPARSRWPCRSPASANVPLNQIRGRPVHELARASTRRSPSPTPLVRLPRSSRPPSSAAFFDGGASDIGFATSTNNGASWTSGTLPGITHVLRRGHLQPRQRPGPWRTTRAHNVWLDLLRSALLDTPSGPSGRGGPHEPLHRRWLHVVGNPVNTAVAGRREDLDKNWIVCDNTPSSPFYGSCYTQFDDFGHGNALKMYYSRNGGLTWTAGKVPRRRRHRRPAGSCCRTGTWSSRSTTPARRRSATRSRPTVASGSARRSRSRRSPPPTIRATTAAGRCRRPRSPATAGSTSSGRTAAPGPAARLPARQRPRLT